MDLIIMLFALAFVFWLLIIRPGSKRRQEFLTLQEAIEPGAEVVLQGGVYGTVIEVDDIRLKVEIAEGVVVTVHRQGIARLVGEQYDQLPGSDAEVDSDIPEEGRE